MKNINHRGQSPKAGCSFGLELPLFLISETSLYQKLFLQGVTSQTPLLQKIILGILLSRYDILAIDKRNASLLLTSSVSNSLCFKMTSKSRNKAFKCEVFFCFGTYHLLSQISLKFFSNQLSFMAKRSSIKRNALANFLAFSK